jgi:hypothetical protein
LPYVTPVRFLAHYAFALNRSTCPTTTLPINPLPSAFHISPFPFQQSIATIRGDLSNITAPPFVLATKSAVEFPAYWAERPDIFVAPASEPDPQRRALLVLKWFLAALKQQQYAGRDERDGVKKPLNAFLGELFLASWDGGEEGVKGTTRLVSEQVR